MRGGAPAAGCGVCRGPPAAPLLAAGQEEAGGEGPPEPGSALPSADSSVDALEEEKGEDLPNDEELQGLKANAVAAWFVNIVLVAWILWLYQRGRQAEAPSIAKDKQSIITLLSQELADESTALTSDRKLKEDLQRQVEAIADVAKRIEVINPDADAAPSAESVVKELQAMLATRELELQRDMEETNRELRELTEVTVVRPVDDSLVGPLTNTVSPILAGVDVVMAGQFISLALLFTFASERLRRGGQGDVTAVPGNTTDGLGAPSLDSDDEASEEGARDPTEEKRLRSQCVLRFYGHWDGEETWVLLQTVPLQGYANSVIGTVRSARGWMGSWSDRLITKLVARSARGMVRRRGWKRIVEQTMSEVGRTFTLGYLVETAADKAWQRIEVDDKARMVLEVPSDIVLEP